MHAIPTRYAGVNFRSRLEARWAAMFDLLNWRWDYEPLDLAGYIPDFVLQFSEPLLVEVKPAMTLGECTTAALRLVGAADPPMAVFGASIHIDTVDVECMGLIKVLGFPWAGMQIRKCAGHWTPTSAEGSWRCMLCESQPGRTNAPHNWELLMDWHEAGNHAQWKPVSPR